jgi:hypothetical protein
MIGRLGGERWKLGSGHGTKFPPSARRLQRILPQTIVFGDKAPSVATNGRDERRIVGHLLRTRVVKVARIAPVVYGLIAAHGWFTSTKKRG